MGLLAHSGGGLGSAPTMRFEELFLLSNVKQNFNNQEETNLSPFPHCVASHLVHVQAWDDLLHGAGHGQLRGGLLDAGEGGGRIRNRRIRDFICEQNYIFLKHFFLQMLRKPSQ